MNTAILPGHAQQMVNYAFPDKRVGAAAVTDYNRKIIADSVSGSVYFFLNGFTYALTNYDQAPSFLLPAVQVEGADKLPKAGLLINNTALFSALQKAQNPAQILTAVQAAQAQAPASAPAQTVVTNAPTAAHKPNWLLIAAIAGGAYFLLKHKK